MATCLAAAVKEGWTGPVFIQGDHFQLNAKNYNADPEKELDEGESVPRKSPTDLDDDDLGLDEVDGDVEPDEEVEEEKWWD